MDNIGESITITYKVSPQGLHYFEAEIDGGRWYHVSNQMRRTRAQAEQDAALWLAGRRAVMRS